MSTDPLAPLIDRLHASRLRTWSVIITIFGDCIQPRGGRAAMTELQALTDRLGIEGGALRTAMSRLAKDGWVERDREGRNSFYVLTRLGEATFLPATRQIYRARFTASGPWTIAISPALPDPNGSTPALEITRQVRIIGPECAGHHRETGDLVLQGEPDAIPDWVRSAAIDSHLSTEYAELADLLATLTPEALAALSPLDALAMRVLLIHFWRRLVLRHPAPPEGLIEPDWPGQTCHAALARLYPALIAPSETWWPTVTPAEGLEALTRRFA